MTDPAFAHRLVAWHREHGRHDLPWQSRGADAPDPYPIWIAEIMLQQTQVATVIPYFQRFMQRFPDLRALAAAPAEAVMAHWSGLGYYARARNLHRAALWIAAQHGGVFPASPAEIAALPGVGRSTAAAIAAFAFGTRAAILDGNVKRVLCRRFGIEGFPGAREVETRLWTLAESLLPVQDIGPYTQALMDLGATLCTRARPACGRCPLANRCAALQAGRVDALPTPRPRRETPQRNVRVLILEDAGRVLLEQRPPAGIWGGLLALPELQGDPAEVETEISQRFDCDLESSEVLPALRHAFTHFRLEMLPLRCRVRDRGTALREPGLRWLKHAELAAAPLPAPVRKLLARR